MCITVRFLVQITKWMELMFTALTLIPTSTSKQYKWTAEVDKPRAWARRILHVRTICFSFIVALQTNRLRRSIHFWLLQIESFYLVCIFKQNTLHHGVTHLDVARACIIHSEFLGLMQMFSHTFFSHLVRMFCTKQSNLFQKSHNIYWARTQEGNLSADKLHVHSAGYNTIRLAWSNQHNHNTHTGNTAKPNTPLISKQYTVSQAVKDIPHTSSE